MVRHSLVLSVALLASACDSGPVEAAKTSQAQGAAQARSAGPAVAVYVIDTSGSMAKGDLYNRLLSELQFRYGTALRKGDAVGIMTFDTAMHRRAEFVFEDQRQMAEALAAVRRGKPTGKYTHLTGAVREASRWVQELKAKHPDRRADVYIFTDGKNEPPPGASAPTDWQGVLRDEFASAVLKRPDAGVYIVKLPGADLAAADVPKEIAVVEGPRGGERLTGIVLRLAETTFPQAEIVLKGRMAGEVSEGKRPRQAKISLRAEKLFPPGEPVTIALAPPDGVKVSPERITFTRDAPEHAVTVDHKLPIAAGAYEVRIAVRPVTPNLDTDSEFRLVGSVRVQVVPPWWSRVPKAAWAALAALVLLLAIYLSLAKFGDQKVTVGRIPYVLRSKAGFPYHSVVLGPPGGVPFGTRGSPVAKLTAIRARRTRIEPLGGREVLVNGRRLEGAEELPATATIEVVGEREAAQYTD